jgi:hypothetical protein
MRRPLIAFLALCGGAAAAKDPGDKEPGPVDISASRARMTVIGNEQGLIALVPFPDGDADRDALFWSADGGKTFHKMWRRGFGRSGNERYDVGFWEPRFVDGWMKTLGWREGGWFVQCGERTVRVKELERDRADDLLDGAKFLDRRFQRSPYALARDDRGVYYYIDRITGTEKQGFRLFVGPKGALKLTKLVNVVSDTEGDVFATKTGELRLVLSKNEAVWIKGKARTDLVSVVVEDNLPMIFTELGVYAGQPLGSPCDSL